MPEHHCCHCCTHRRRHETPRSYKTHRRYTKQTRGYRNNDDICAICLAPANEVQGPLDAICDSELPAESNHYFHTGCLDTWLTTGYNLCPVCRQRPCRSQAYLNNLPGYVQPVPPGILAAQNQVLPPLWLGGPAAIRAAFALEQAQQEAPDDDDLPPAPMLHRELNWLFSMNCDQCGRVTGSDCGRCSDCHLQYGAPQNENTQAGDNVYCNGHHLM